MADITTTIAQIKKDFSSQLAAAKNLEALETIRIAFLGRQGSIAELMVHLKTASVDEKRTLGPALNELKNWAQTQFDEKKQIIETSANQAELDRERQFDVTAYKYQPLKGGLHVYTKFIRQLSDIFISMGYEIVDGPEVIEKAHPDVWNMLLQIMEEGRLTDNVGRVVDFKNAIVIMTTNIGAEQIVGRDSFGFQKKDDSTNYDKMKQTVRQEMDRNVRPEFLNRVDDIIVFRSLNGDDLKHIVDIELSKVTKRLRDKGLNLTLTDGAKEFLIEKGTSLEFGARPLRRAIEHSLEDPLSEDLLRGLFVGKDKINVVVTGEGEDRKLIFETTDKVVVPPPAPPAEAELATTAV